MALELKSVGKRVEGVTHIHPMDLTLEPGSFNVLLGTTLAGKTTLMQLMAGLERPTEGEIHFDGRDVTGVSVQKRNVSMVYQQFINYPNFSVYDNIASPLKLARMAKADIDRRVHEMAELMRLTPFLKRRPSELSGGQQQRTAMARALVKDANLVLLDEPLANLDFKLREELRDELPKLFADRNCIAVYATTEPMEALLFGGNTATLHEGRVTQFGPTMEIYKWPIDLVSAQVFSEPPMNEAPVQKAGRRFSLGDLAWDADPALDDMPDGEYRLGIRPHRVTIEPRGDQPVAVTGAVKIAELSGSESTVHFVLQGNDWVSLSHGVHDFEIGAPATFHVDMSRAMYFDADGHMAGAAGDRAG
ncbi:MAG: ABC transporter ATP-binding protein [Rhizobiales bacterium NRL2]|jgi:glycerol transport system ATP-binding protein|nr:MAG: ABC transporter ATP-binding protein [Rhizobiales bacterium NRL2]